MPPADPGMRLLVVGGRNPSPRLVSLRFQARARPYAIIQTYLKPLFYRFYRQHERTHEQSFWRKNMATEMKRSDAIVDRLEELLGPETRELLDHKARTIPKDQIHLPGPDYIDRVVSSSDRS